MIEAVAALVPILHELNDNKVIKAYDKYPVLKTELTNAEIWWDGLKYEEKMEVGSVALHYYKMSPNYKWKCKDSDLYQDLTKGQKKIVNFVLSKKNDNWYMFDIAGMLKL